MLLVCLIAALNCASVGYDSSMMSSLNILSMVSSRNKTIKSPKDALTSPPLSDMEHER